MIARELRVEVADRRLRERVEDALGDRAGARSRAAGGARGAVTAPRAPGSARRGARAARRGSSGARPARRCGSAASSSFWPSVGTSETIQRTASRSKRNSTARCQASSVARPGRAGSRCMRWRVSGDIDAAQHEHVAVGVGVLALRRAQLLDARRARARACPSGACRRRARAARARRRSTALAWPGQHAAGSSAASLRIDARACSVSKLYAAMRQARAALSRPCVERVEAVAGQRQAVATRATARSAPARGPGRWTTSEARRRRRPR